MKICAARRKVYQTPRPVPPARRESLRRKYLFFVRNCITVNSEQQRMSPHCQDCTCETVSCRTATMPRCHYHLCESRQLPSSSIPHIRSRHCERRLWRLCACRYFIDTVFIYLSIRYSHISTRFSKLFVDAIFIYLPMRYSILCRYGIQIAVMRSIQRRRFVNGEL